MFEAREKSANLEYEIFMRIREEVSKYIQRLQAPSPLRIMTADVLQSLARLLEPAFDSTWIRDDLRIDIQKGRHVVVKKVMGAQTYSKYDSDGRNITSIQLITGQTWKREVNLTCASVSHDGGYGPAWVSYKQRKAPIYRFLMHPARTGAADDLAFVTTFMVGDDGGRNNAISHATSKIPDSFDEFAREL